MVECFNLILEGRALSRPATTERGPPDIESTKLATKFFLNPEPRTLKPEIKETP
jgi:hypothetical protein